MEYSSDAHHPGVAEGPDGGFPPQAAFATAFRHSPTAIALLALGGRVLHVSDSYRRRLGPLAEEPVTVPPTDQPTASIALPSGETGQLRLLSQPSGTPVWWLLSLSPAASEVYRDPLTGLPDRRLLLDRLTHALSRRGSAAKAVEVVVFDVDEFKMINDRHGHVVGDRVLLEIAARLSGCVRPADTVARWGGDEFVVLLEDASELGGALVCERAAAALAEPIPLGDGALTVVVSCGWVQAAADDALGLLHRADLEMYRVKRGRKNPTRRETLAELQTRLLRAHTRSRELGQLSTDSRARAQLLVQATQARQRSRKLG
jgi:diguanylate cyclase (GGDEF)-like protein